MGKYARYETKQVEEEQPIHPIWRGIGFAIGILIPLLSGYGAGYLVRQNQVKNWFPLPPELYGNVDIVTPLAFIPNQPIQDLLAWIQGILNQIYLIDILLTVALIVIGFGLMTVFYGFVYRLANPNRYGPYDVAPIKKSPKKGVKARY